MKKLLLAVLVLGLLGALAACGENTPSGPVVGNDGNTTIIIGATPRPHREILEYLRPYLLQENIVLDIREFTDFHVVNPALAGGELHANYFQHTPFLNASPYADRLTMLGLIHIEPIGAYSLTLNDISELPHGGVIGIPNDATNLGRGLLLLQAHGLIEVDPAAGILATESDVTYNPLNLQFRPLDAAFLPQALNDPQIDMAIINTNHVLAGTNLNPMRDSLIIETPDSPYGNGLTVRTEDADHPAFQILLRHLQSERVRAFIFREYDGAVLPVF